MSKHPHASYALRHLKAATFVEDPVLRNLVHLVLEMQLCLSPRTQHSERETIAYVRAQSVPILVTDLQCASLSPICFLRSLREASPGTSVVVLASSLTEPLSGRRYLECGADALLGAQDVFAQLARTVLRVFRGTPSWTFPYEGNTVDGA